MRIRFTRTVVVADSEYTISWSYCTNNKMDKKYLKMNPTGESKCYLFTKPVAVKAYLLFLCIVRSHP